MLSNNELKVFFLIIFAIGILVAWLTLGTIKDKEKRKELFAQLGMFLATVSAMFLIYLFSK